MRQVRMLRRERGLSQERLAARAGLTTWTINRLEAGKINPTLQTVQRVADALGVEIVDLFPRTKELATTG